MTAGAIRICGAIVLLVSAQGMGFADDKTCTLAGWGDGHRKVVDRGEEWTYVLKSSGSDWQIGPGDRHTQGHIFCESCGWGATIPNGASGEFWWGPSVSEPSPPSTAAERAGRRTESIPHFVFRPNQLEVRGTRGPITLGPLSGYAVLYRVALPHLPQEGESPAIVEGSFLAIYLKDACIEFEATILGKPSSEGDRWRPLDSFLSDVTIAKNPSAEAEIPKR